MSGFEIVGLILALYPVIGTAIQTYKTVKSGSSRVASLAKWLRVEQSLFGKFVHDLLAPNVSEAELVILKDPKSSNIELWKDPTLQTKLEHRLGSEIAEIVIETLQEVNRLLRSLHDELSSSNQRPEHRIRLPRRFRANLDNVRHCLPQSNLKEQLDMVSRNNGLLVRLLADYSLPNTATSKTVPAAVRQFLRRDSSYAIDLYDAICVGYQCDCNAPHVANFSIPRITNRAHANISSLRRKWQFDLLFPVEDEANTPEDGYKIASEQSWGPETDSTLCSGFDLDRHDVTRPQLNTWGTTNGGIKKIRKQRSRSISICECNDSGVYGKYGRIQDLCILIKTLDTKASAADTYLGILQLKEKQYKLQMLLSEQSISASQDLKSLDDLLTTRRFLLSRKERIGLAVKLSYAVLQFYYTPWIGNYWTWGDFCLDDDDDPQLFITRKFYSTRKGTSASNSSESLSTDAWAPYREPILTRLGFALIELALGKRLAKLRPKQSKSGLDQHTIDLRTAQDLVDNGRLLREEGRVYEDIVSVCLNHQIYCPSQSKVVTLRSGAPNFQENVELHIIAPLHKIWTTCWGDE